MHIVPFHPEHITAAAALFVSNFRVLRLQVPLLPQRMADPDHVAERLAPLAERAAGLALLHNGRLLAYLTWYLVDNFRGTPRRGAYVPEWGHGALPDRRAPLYRALYRAASAEWAQAGCAVHAITLLAHDEIAREIWFWNGFGLTVVDALRSLEPLAVPPPPGVELRRATAADASLVAVLEREHWQHYEQPPLFMVANAPDDAQALAALIADPVNSIWLALQEGEPLAYMRFEGSAFGAATIVESETTAAITAAYTRPSARGQGIAPALLNAGLRYYAGKDFARCSVDFESFNPEAAAFWPNYFEPVAFSLLRVPEALPAASQGAP